MNQANVWSLLNRSHAFHFSLRRSIFVEALPVFRAVGVVWFAVNCFSAMTYGGRLAILFTGRKPLRSSDLR